MKDANPAFDLTHEKSMVVDDETAFVKSLNWATRNLTETRDYAVVTTRRHDVAEIIECFEADWHRHAFDAAATRAIWSGVPDPGATGSASSSTRRGTGCSCRTSATRTW